MSTGEGSGVESDGGAGADVGDDGWPVTHAVESGERRGGRHGGDGGVGEVVGGGWRDGDDGGGRGRGWGGSGLSIRYRLGCKGRAKAAEEHEEEQGHAHSIRTALCM